MYPRNAGETDKLSEIIGIHTAIGIVIQMIGEVSEELEDTGDSSTVEFMQLAARHQVLAELLVKLNKQAEEMLCQL